MEMKGIAISAPIIKKDKNSGIFIEKLTQVSQIKWGVKIYEKINKKSSIKLV